jgi:hypothetical protein
MQEEKKYAFCDNDTRPNENKGEEEEEEDRSVTG